MARIVAFPSAQSKDGPVVGSITNADFSGEPRVVRDPMVATSKMWWRATGRLAYSVGVTFSAVELPLLVPDAEHEANMRAGVTDAEAPPRQHPSAGPVQSEPLVPVETRIITHAPEVRDDERRTPGRPRLPRDEQGNVLRP